MPLTIQRGPFTAEWTKAELYQVACPHCGKLMGVVTKTVLTRRNHCGCQKPHTHHRKERHHHKFLLSNHEIPADHPWQAFDTFLTDVGEIPNQLGNVSLVKIDPRAPHSATNTRWDEYKRQTVYNIGDRVNFWTVLKDVSGFSYDELDVDGVPFRENEIVYSQHYLVQCVCGKQSVLTGGQLNYGQRRSCGCQPDRPNKNRKRRLK